MPASCYLADAHVLDPDVGKWERLAPMFTGRESMGITLMKGNKIFTCGGHYNEGDDPIDHYTNTTEIYDIGKDSWTREAPMPERKAWLDAATVGERRRTRADTENALGFVVDLDPGGKTLLE